MDQQDGANGGHWRRPAGVVGGGMLGAVILLFCNLDPANPAVTRTAAVAALMALWWITEAVPIPVTSLLPVALFPLLGIMDGKSVASQYFNHIVFLFIGGFIVALALERWNLHKRIALRILLLFGIRPRSMLLGLMVTTAFLSMWISNTAAVMMMATIVLAIILELEDKLGRQAVRRYTLALLLGVAYSGSVGGMATLVGTPPNMSFARIFEIQFPGAPDISFAAWFAFGFPVSVALLILVWLYLSCIYTPRKGELAVDQTVIRQQYAALGRLSFAEGVVLADFIVLALLWVFRADISIGGLTVPGWSRLFGHPEYINDGTVAIALAVPLFLVPARHGPGTRIMDWPTAARLPWNIVLLFGGGFALASGFTHSGLSLWLGEQLAGAGALNPYLLVAIVCLTITFMTEFTSNTATAEMILPCLAGLAVAINLNPLLLMVPAALSCSCAFMMPVATPPNAIIFGTDRLRIWDMAKTGLAINLIAAVLILLGTFILGRLVWGIDITQMPNWATGR